MFRIGKRYSFDAAHKLNGLPSTHKCANLHGHTYTVEIAIESEELDDTGFVVDFGSLNPLKEYIDTILDHMYLNDVLPDNPTSENIAKHLYGVASNILRLPPGARISVRVSETPNTWALYSG